VLASQRDRRLIGQALNRGAYASWDYRPHANGAMRYVRSRADLYQLQKNARLDSADAVPPGPRLRNSRVNSNFVGRATGIEPA
jgi:Choline sulfatase enzyme C terminal